MEGSGRGGLTRGVALALLLWLLVPLAGAEGAAPIKIRLKNESRQTINVAINYLTQGGRWMTRGWWVVEPGQIVTTDIVTDNQFLYFFAEGTEGGLWSGNDEKGSVERWIVDDKFSWYDDAPGQPPGENPKRVLFFERKARESDYTMSFTD